MLINFVGAGHLGSAALFAMILLDEEDAYDDPKCVCRSPTKYVLTDVDAEKLDGEFKDLLPVAVALGHRLEKTMLPVPDADLYVITAGSARKNFTKEQLLEINQPIVERILERCNPNAKKIVATNPPEEICDGIMYDQRLVPFGVETDNLRARGLGFDARIRGSHSEPKCDDADALNAVKALYSSVVLQKGYTSWSPGFALAKRVLREVC